MIIAQLVLSPEALLTIVGTGFTVLSGAIGALYKKQSDHHTETRASLKECEEDREKLHERINELTLKL